MKLFKRILSLALALLLLLGTCQNVFAEAPGTQAQRTSYPTIYLAGGWHELKDSATGESVFSPESSLHQDTSIQDTIINIALTQNYDALGVALAEMFTSSFTNIAMNCDGESINKDVTYDFKFYLNPGLLEQLNGQNIEDIADPNLKLIKENLGTLKSDGSLYLNPTPGDDQQVLYFQDNEGYFSFDWRQDPVQNAEILHTWIKEAIITPGYSDKVNLVFVSGSGPIGLAYLNEYKTEYLNAIAFNESLHNGSSLWGGIAARQFGLSADAVGNTGPMYDFALDSLLTPPVRGVVRVLYEIGLIDIMMKGINYASTDAFNSLYEDALIPMWFHMPFYWSVVPHSMYEQAKRALFPTDAEYAAHAKLFEKTDYYQNEVLANSDHLLREAAKVIKVGINCGYGFPVSPFTKISYVSSDEIVDTAYASSGATCAPPNRPFSAFFYKQAVPGDVNYISPDRIVDASTCVLPEYTWFNKDMPHMPDLRVDGWVEWFVNAPRGKDSVRGNPDYPQWMKWNAWGDFAPLEYTDTLWAKIWDTLLAALTWITDGWRGIVRKALFWM